VASVTDVLEKVFTLTSNVDSLTKDVERLNGAMKEHHERIVRLEGRDELIAEKAKNAALQAVVQTNQALLKQIGDLESQLKRLVTSPD
jgi:chromosome segregation ATPase